MLTKAHCQGQPLAGIMALYSEIVALELIWNIHKAPVVTLRLVWTEILDSVEGLGEGCRREKRD